MSDFKVTSITNRDGSHGPQMCGIVTFTGSGLTLPNGILTGPRGRGVFGGGYSPGASPYAVVNTIDYVNIATTGNALDFGDLTQARSGISATASSTRGVFGGGKITPLGSDYYQSTIDFIEIQSAGNAFDFGDLNDSLGRPAAAADSTRAVFAGGYNNSLAPLFHPVGDLQYITISTKGNTSSFGNQFFGRYSMGAAASPTRALYFGGGFGHPSITNLNIIDFVTIATLGDAQDYGDLTEQARLVASCANSTRGLACCWTYSHQS